MNWRNIRLIFQRELRDQLRDRRTLFMIAVLPLLLYPALGIGTVQMQLMFSEQARTVVILGAADIPQMGDVPLLKDGQFNQTLFDMPGEAEKLAVVTDQTPPTDNDPKHLQRYQDLMQDSREISAALPEMLRLDAIVKAADDPKHPRAKAAPVVTPEALAEARLRLKEQKDKIGSLFAKSDMHVLIVIPPKFGQNLEDAATALAGRLGNLDQATGYPRPDMVFNKAIDRSLLSYQSVKGAFEEWETQLLKAQLRVAKLPEGLTQPVNPVAMNLAHDAQIADNFWSKLFPALLVIMAMTGAFYPAIDLVAGEKERGTMETLLICPAKRSEIVLGKFFTVMSFSCATALLNLASLGFTSRHMLSMGKGLMPRVGDLSLPSPVSMLWIVLLLIPLSALFSALCLALATLARSSKEGQYYLTPLLMVAMGMTVFCMSPAIDLTPRTAIYSVVPIANIALLLKGLLSTASQDAGLIYLVPPVLIASFGYAAMALWWAVDQFNREDVLFRESEQFDIRLWIKHLLRDKEPLPTFSEAAFCFMLIMFLQFGAMQPLNAAFEAVAGSNKERALIQMLLIQQVAIIATTPLFMGVMLTSDVRRTLRLRLPPFSILAASIVLPFALHPLSSELISSITWPELPASVKFAIETMGSTAQPEWLVLLGFAFAPAICEEVAFRGFILSGFGRNGRKWLPIVLSSVLFGLMHMIPQQVFNATLIGLVLGIIAIRSRSLLPCIAFHFVYNSLGVFQGRLAETVKQSPANLWVTADPEGHVRYQWPTLTIAAIVGGSILYWLIRRDSTAAATNPTIRRVAPRLTGQLERLA